MQGQKQRVAVGLIIAGACVAIFLDWPMYGALKVSRGEMDRLAQSMMASGEPYADDQWLGVYRATRIKAIPGGVRFTCEEQNRAYRSGFMYLPKVEAKSMTRGRRSYVYLGDGWFAWREEG
jgi:hypothetical protein